MIRPGPEEGWADQVVTAYPSRIVCAVYGLCIKAWAPAQPQSSNSACSLVHC